MATTIRPEVSQRNKHWIERHRYYELVHFCRQYYIWKREYSELDGMANSSHLTEERPSETTCGKPVESCVEKRLYYANRIEMLENVARDTDPVIGPYILKAVTTGASYASLKARLDIPCCKDTYYELYRRFFWLLDKARG